MRRVGLGQAATRQPACGRAPNGKKPFVDKQTEFAAHTQSFEYRTTLQHPGALAVSVPFWVNEFSTRLNNSILEIAYLPQIFICIGSSERMNVHEWVPATVFCGVETLKTCESPVGAS